MNEIEIVGVNKKVNKVTEKTPGQIAFANYTYALPNDTIAGHGWENLPPSIKSNWEESAAAVLAAAAEPWLDRPDCQGDWWVAEEGRELLIVTVHNMHAPFVAKLVRSGAQWQRVKQPQPPANT